MAREADYMRAAEALLKIANDMELSQLSSPVDEATTAAPVSFVCAGCGQSTLLDDINSAREQAAGESGCESITEQDSVQCPSCGGTMSVRVDVTPGDADLQKESALLPGNIKGKVHALYRKVPKQTLLKAVQAPIEALTSMGEKALSLLVEAIEEHDDEKGSHEAPRHDAFPIHEEEGYNIKTAGMADQFSNDPHGDESMVAGMVLYALEKGITTLEELKTFGPAKLGELLSNVQTHMKGDHTLNSPSFTMQASGLLPALSESLPSKLLTIVKGDRSSLNNPHAVDVAKMVQSLTEEEAAKAVRALSKGGVPDAAMKTAGAVNYKAILAAVLGLAAATMAGEGKSTQNLKTDLTTKHWSNLISNVDQASAKNESLRQLVENLGQYAHSTATDALSETYSKDKAPADSSVAMGTETLGRIPDPGSAPAPAQDQWETRNASMDLTAGVDMERLRRYL